MRRTPHGVVPTPSGRAFLARAQVAQSELRKAEEEAVQAEGEGVGSVAFGVATSALQIVPEAVTHFRQQFPHARLRILEGVPRALLPLVRDETLDLATGPRPDAKLDHALAFRPLFRDDVVVLEKSDMLGIMSRRLLAERFARDVLQEIAVAEPMPSYTVGMFTRTSPPLTRVAAGMAKAVTTAARKLARPI